MTNITRGSELWSIHGIRSEINPANSIMSYSGTDDLENIKQYNPARINDSSVVYRFNSLGLRTGELAPVPDKFAILTSGCSITMGVGLAEQDIWPTLLQHKFTNGHVFNVAHGGASMDYVVRSVYVTAKQVKPDLICVLSPEQSRFEVVYSGHLLHVNVHSVLYPRCFSSDLHHEQRQHKNIIFLEMFAKIHGIPLVIINHNHPGLDRVTDIPARDGIHPGPAYHKRLADLFYDEYQKIINNDFSN